MITDLEKLAVKTALGIRNPQYDQAVVALMKASAELVLATDGRTEFRAQRKAVLTAMEGVHALVTGKGARA